jgi:hypothetical protein
MTSSEHERFGLMLELVRQQRLERRPASRALPRAPLGAMDAAGEDRYRVLACGAHHVLAVAAVRDAGDQDRVYVEPEAEREHPATVAPPPRREEDGVPARYASGEEGEVVAAGSR